MAETENISKETSEFFPIFYKIIEEIKSRGITITDDLCRSICKSCTEIYAIGYKQGIDYGCDTYEKRLSKFWTSTGCLKK